MQMQLTDKQKELLKKFATDHYPNSDKNMATHHPLFIVQTRDEEVINEEYNHSDGVRFYITDWGTGYDNVTELINDFWDNEPEVCPIPIVPFDKLLNTTVVGIDGSNICVVNEEDYLNVYNFNMEYDLCHIQYCYRSVAYFFIKDEAEAYIEYQRHNLVKPRIYCVGAGYANYGDYHHFYELLMSMGQELLKENKND